MPFQPGHKLSKGKPKGSHNKRTYEFVAVLEKHNFDPAAALIECYRDAKWIYDNYAKIHEGLVKGKQEQGDPYPVENEASKYLKIAGDLAKEIAGYAYPKLKSIEIQKNNPLKDMTPEQKLEAMKHAVSLLESQLKEAHGSGAV